MSRIEKGGNKFKPLARPQAPVRPKPAAARPAAPPAAAAETGAPPASVSVSGTAGVGTVGSAAAGSQLPPAFSQTQGTTPSSLPVASDNPSSSSAPPPPSTQSQAPPSTPAQPSSTDEAVPLRAPKPINPYLDRAAPPPVFSPPTLKEVNAAQPRGGGRVAPTLALSGGTAAHDVDDGGEPVVPRNRRAPTLALSRDPSPPPPPPTQAVASTSTSASTARRRPVPAVTSQTNGSLPPPASSEPSSSARPASTAPAKSRPVPRKRGTARVPAAATTATEGELATTNELSSSLAPTTTAVPDAGTPVESAPPAAGPSSSPLVPTRNRRLPPPQLTASVPSRHPPRSARSAGAPGDGILPVGESESEHEVGEGSDDDFEAALNGLKGAGKGKGKSKAAGPKTKKVTGEEGGGEGEAASPPKKRCRLKKAPAVDEDGNPVPPPAKKRRTSKAATADGDETKPKRKPGRPRKKITTPPLEGADGESEVEEVPFDLSTATMSELCVDPGVGRISSRFEEIQRKARDLKEARKAARLRMKQRVKVDREGGRAFDEVSDEEAAGEGKEGEDEAPSKGSAAALDGLDIFRKKSSQHADEGQASEAGPSNSGPVEPNEDQSDDDDYGASTSRSNQLAPQMRVVNGQLVLDQDSLQIDQHAQAEEQAGMYEEIEERDLDRFVNQDTWRKNPRGERWGKDETELFYDALQQFGSDFEMIARLFPGRTRKMVKNKFTREEKYNETRVTKALTVKIPIDMKAYEKATRKDFSGPAPVIKIPTPPPQSIRATSEGAQSATSAGTSQADGPGGKKRKRRGGRDGEEIMGLVEDREPTPEPVEEVEEDPMAEFM